MESQRLTQFLQDLVKMKETLQESLHLFRQAQRRVKRENPADDSFVYRRLIQMEHEALLRFKTNIKLMNDLVEKLLGECEQPLEKSTDWQAFQLISKELKSLQNSFDQESPVLGAALQKVENRFLLDS